MTTQAPWINRVRVFALQLRAIGLDGPIVFYRDIAVPVGKVTVALRHDNDNGSYHGTAL